MLGTFFFIVFAIVVAVIVLDLIFAGAGFAFGIITLLINGAIWAFKKLFHIGGSKQHSFRKPSRETCPHVFSTSVTGLPLAGRETDSSTCRLPNLSRREQ